MAVERALGALIPLMPFIFVIFIICLGLREKEARARNHTELQKELIAKFPQPRTCGRW